MPQSPPDYAQLIQAESGDGLTRALSNTSAVDYRRRYLHWDQMRRRTPPNGLTLEQWWIGTAIARQATRRQLPMTDAKGRHFVYSNVDQIQELLHQIDRQASGQILADDVVTNLQASDRYLISSLVEEAITSSQLEGASTTRRVAKELLQSGRQPRDRSEQMIFNNYKAMVQAETLADQRKLEVEDICSLHRTVTEYALDDERDSGRLQTPDEDRIAIYWTDNTVLHKPPPAELLPQRLQALCDFANQSNEADIFLHPVVRAIVIHFWLAYDHPFVDGNGRTSRALFYWSMLGSGYWLSQYISISSILRKAPAKYARSYLHVETDGNDMTYFILYQLEVISQAIANLGDYLSRKIAETREIESLVHQSSDLNNRQLAVISRALRDPDAVFTFRTHERSHRVAYQSARTDLLGLENLGMLERSSRGRQFQFRAVADLSARLRELGNRDV